MHNVRFMERIERLDIQLINACNLSCRGCISLSDFNRKGLYTINNLEKDCENWSKKISPKVITLFGGEPLLHPNFAECINVIRTFWPNCTLRLITNGLMLNRFSPDSWFGIDNFEMQISIHRDDDKEKIISELKKILSFSTWKYEKSNLSHIFWKVKNKKLNFAIWCSKFKDFVQPYDIVDGDIKPCNSNPKNAHSICGSPNTPALLNGKLFKCPPVANILNLKDNWLGYTGYSVNDDIKEFVKNINQPESVCSGCPETQSHAFDHFDMKNIPIIKRRIL